MSKKISDEEVKLLITDIINKRRQSMSRIMLERTWFRNILYYLGEQWIQWYVEQNSFKKRYRKSTIPTPVTNRIRDAVRSEKALILNKDYVPRVWPNSEQPEDKEASRTGELILRDMDLRNDQEFKEDIDDVALWMLLCGTAFMRSFPDMDAGDYAIDNNGEFLKTGDVVSRAASPFSMILDQMGIKLRDKRYVGIISLKDKEWVEDTFKIKINSASSKLDNQYLHTLEKYVGNVSPWKSAGITSSLYDNELEEKVEFKEIEFKPTRKFPYGRYVVMANDDVIINIDKMPLINKKNPSDWMYSFTDFHYNKTTGRFWSDAFVNDLISPQNSINSIDQALVMNRRSLGRPRVTLPINCKIERINEQGQSFLAIRYDPRVTAGQAPKFDNGLPLPNQVLIEREHQEKALQDAAGDPKNIMRGHVPTAGASGYLVDVLQESAESSHSPDIMRFYRSLTRVYRKRLLLARDIYTESRIIKIKGPNNEIQIKKFKGADIRNNTDVRLELTSGVFKTKASEAHALLNLMQTGMIQLDPVTQRKVLNRLGFAELSVDKNDVHTKRAEKEEMNASAGDVTTLFVTSPDPQTGEVDLDFDRAKVVNHDPLFKFDDHAIHYESHTRFILSDEFKALSPEVSAIFMAHTELHKAIMDAEMKKIQMENMAQEQALKGNVVQSTPEIGAPIVSPKPESAIPTGE